MHPRSSCVGLTALRVTNTPDFTRSLLGVSSGAMMTSFVSRYLFTARRANCTSALPCSRLKCSSCPCNGFCLFFSVKDFLRTRKGLLYSFPVASLPVNFRALGICADPASLVHLKRCWGHHALYISLRCLPKLPATHWTSGNCRVDAEFELVALRKGS